MTVQPLDELPPLHLGSRRRRRAMFLVLALGYQLVFLHGVIMTVFAKELMRDMNLSPTGMGLLGSSYLYAYAAVMLVSGILAAWAGPRAIVGSFFTLSGLGGLLFAFSHSLPVAMVGRSLSGAGLAVTMTSSFTLFSRWYSPASYSRMCAYFFAIGGVGNLGGIALMPVLNDWWGWRAVFAGIAVLTVIYAGLAILLVKNWPPANTRISARGSTDITRADMTMSLLWRDIKAMAKNWDFWRISIWFASLPGIYFAFFGLWAIPYLTDVYGFSDTETGLMVSLGGVGFSIGSPVASWFNDKIWRSYRISLGGSGIGSLALLAVLLVGIDSLGKLSLYLWMTAFGIFLNSTNALAHSASRNLFGTRMAGVTGGVYGCCAFLGGAAMQILCGRILAAAAGRAWTPTQAYLYAFLPLIVCALVGTWTGFTLSRSSDRNLRLPTDRHG
ncbi:MAG: MFS transporter [Planctomycetes bacterium]|nr:MFS transporter [Planctomycetota bacterium]